MMLLAKMHRGVHFLLVYINILIELIFSLNIMLHYYRTGLSFGI